MNDDLINVDNLKPFPKFCCTIGMLPTVFKVSWTYEEQMLECIRFIKEEIIPKVNMNALATKELQEKFVELVNYVNEYFENLDLQEEVNNKLEEMVESGDLQEIITAYINLKSILCYNTVADMKNATNLVNGSFAQTLGFYNANDGGNATYKIRTITNEDVVDNSRIISLNNDDTLIAELMYNHKLNVKTFGAKGDGETDDTNIIQNVINYSNIGDTIYFPNGQYLVKDLEVNKRINFVGENATTISTNGSTLKLAQLGSKILNIIGTNANRLVGIDIKNLGFNGNGLETTTLIDVKYATYVNITQCSFNNVNGSAIQYACVFESGIYKSVFRRCGNETNAVIDFLNYLDSTPNNNTNNFHIQDNTFGYNSGNWIKCENSANTEILWIKNNKLEYDGTPNWANDNENAIIYLGNIFRCFIIDNTFTHFKLTNNKYTKVIHCHSGSGAVSIIDNKLTDVEGTFVITENPIIIMQKNLLYNCANLTDIDVSNSQSINQIEPSYSYNTNGSLNVNKINNIPTLKNYYEAYKFLSAGKHTLQIDENSFNYTKQCVKTSQNLNILRIQNYFNGLDNTSIKLKFRAKRLDTSSTPVFQLFKHTANGNVYLNLTKSISATDFTWYDFTIPVADILDADYFYIQQNNATTNALIDGFILPL